MSSKRGPSRAVLIVLAVACAGSLAAYVASFALHPGVLSWFDLAVYRDAGRIARKAPRLLYHWQLNKNIRFTYTPFAALLYANGSMLPWWLLRWATTIASLLAIPMAAWLTLGATGRHGRTRVGATLGVAAVAFWLEPVQRGINLGQIEPLLMLLVVWDLTRPDGARWKGGGIGLAAGIKLVPLIFIPYLLLAGKFRQAAVATGVFAATIAAGFAFLAGPSRIWWLNGLFIKPGRTGGVDSLVNQSLLGTLSRANGGVSMARPAWLAVAILIGAVGVIAGAMLYRAGQTVTSWILVGLASLLVSPISWDHHWVWMVPLLALLASLIITSRGALRRWYTAAAVGTAVIFGAWPLTYTGRRAFVTGHGLLGWFIRLPYPGEAENLSGWRVLTWNLYVLTGLAMFAVLVAVAILAWRDRAVTRPGAAEPSRPEAAETGRPAATTTHLDQPGPDSDPARTSHTSDVVS